MSFPLDTQATFAAAVIGFALLYLVGAYLVARLVGGGMRTLSDQAEDEERDAWIDTWADEQEAA